MASNSREARTDVCVRKARRFQKLSQLLSLQSWCVNWLLKYSAAFTRNLCSKLCRPVGFVFRFCELMAADVDDELPNTQELHFSEAHVNVDNIKMRVFQKKSN